MLSEDLVRAYDATRDLSNKGFRAACYSPWVSLYFNTVGDVIACCKNQGFILGNIGRESLDDIWKGARIHQLRKALANYNFGAGCGHCEWQIKSGNYQGVYTRIFEEFPVESQVPEWPAMMEFTISNTCNFECVMCYGELSSSIRGHREQLPPLPKVYDDRFFSDLRRYLPHLKRAKFFGGEPFLAAENYRVFDLMTELGVAIPSHVTTNGSIWNARVEQVLERLPISISVSVDGATKKTFDSIRVNGDFDVVMRNARRFQDYCFRNGRDFNLVHCLMRQNWHEFADFLLLAEEFDCVTWINTVIDPPDSSLFALPPARLLEIVRTMEETGRAKVARLKRNRSIWENEIANLRAHAERHLGGELDSVKADALEGLREAHGVRMDPIAHAWALIGEGKYREAHQEVTKTSETSPQYWYSIVVAAHALRRGGDLAAAEREIERALKLAARRPEVLIERAWLRLDQDRVDEGLRDLEAARALAGRTEQHEVSLLHALGTLLTRKGETARAIEVFDQLLRLRPQDPLFHAQRGWALAQAGRRSEALQAAERALSLQPSFAEADRLRSAVLAV
jgi:Flp pilus assembly protein TadD